MDTIFADVNLVKIDFKELKLEEVIGVGGFCKVTYANLRFTFVHYNFLKCY